MPHLKRLHITDRGSPRNNAPSFQNIGYISFSYLIL